MKKIIAVALSAFISLSFMACTQAENNNDDLLAQEIAALTQRIDELTAELEKNREDNEKTQEQLQAQSETIELMQRQLNNLRGNPIEYTETAPVYGASQTEYITFKSFSNYSQTLGARIGFNDFKEYMLNDFCVNYSYQFCILNPGDNESGIEPHHRSKKYKILVENIAEDGTPVAPIVYQNMQVYNEDISPYNHDVDQGLGGVEYSFSFITYFAPLSPPKADHYSVVSLKFGKQEQEEGYVKRDYINIYLSGECIGTCYFIVNGYVSYEWFRDFFQKNILIISY